MRITLYNTYLNEDSRCNLVKERSCNYNKVDDLSKPELVCKMMCDVFNQDKKTEEYAYMICLNTACRPIGIFEISHGTVNTSLMSTREIFQKALMCNAVYIITTHNHPSGVCKPSRVDDKTTEKIKEAAKLMEIGFLDHIIIGKNCYYSYREAKKI